MNDDRDRGVLNSTPDRVEQRVVGLVAAHLNVRFEHPHSLGDRCGNVVACVRFGVKRRGGKTIRCSPRELQRPLVEPCRHLSLVWVDQCGEAEDAELSQHLHALGFCCAVSNRPFPAHQRTVGIEVLPHLVHHRFRHEMGVYVHHTGQAQRGPHLPYVVGLVVGHSPSSSRPARGG